MAVTKTGRHMRATIESFRGLRALDVGKQAALQNNQMMDILGILE